MSTTERSGKKKGMGQTFFFASTCNPRKHWKSLWQAICRTRAKIVHGICDMDALLKTYFQTLRIFAEIFFALIFMQIFHFFWQWFWNSHDFVKYSLALLVSIDAIWMSTMDPWPLWKATSKEPFHTCLMCFLSTTIKIRFLAFFSRVLSAPVYKSKPNFCKLTEKLGARSREEF